MWVTTGVLDADDVEPLECVATGVLDANEAVEDDAPLVRETGAEELGAAATVAATGVGAGAGAGAGADPPEGGAAAAADAGSADPPGGRFGGRRRWMVRWTTCVFTLGGCAAATVAFGSPGVPLLLPMAQPPRPPSAAAAATDAI